MPDLDSCIPFPIDEETLNDVVSKAKDWAIMHGAAMRSKANFSEDSLQVINGPEMPIVSDANIVHNCLFTFLLYLSSSLLHLFYCRHYFHVVSSKRPSIYNQFSMS